MNLFQIKRFPHKFDAYDTFLNEGIISIGWPLLQNLKGKMKEEMKELLEQHYNLTGRRLGNALGAIWCFYNTMSEGDVIFVRHKKHVSVGIVGPYQYKENEAEPFRHQRSVKWISKNQELADFNDFVHVIVRTPGIVTGSKFTIQQLEDIYR